MCGIIGDIPIEHTNVVTDLLARCPVVSFATTAVEPTINDLAEQIAGNRDFLHGTLAQILSGDIAPRKNPDAISIFSPFGLGVLDLTIGSYAYELAGEQGIGTKIASFFDAT